MHTFGDIPRFHAGLFQPCRQCTAAPVQNVSAMRTVYGSPCSAMQTIYGSPCSDRFSHVDRIRQPLFITFQPCVPYTAAPVHTVSANGPYTAAPVQTVSAMQTVYGSLCSDCFSHAVYGSPCSERFSHVDHTQQPLFRTFQPCKLYTAAPVQNVSAMRTVYSNSCSERFSHADSTQQHLFRTFQPCGQYTVAAVQNVSTMQTVEINGQTVIQPYLYIIQPV